MMNSRDSNISFGAMINFPILSEAPENQERGEPEPSTQISPPVTPVRRRSRSLPSISRMYLSDTFGRPVSMVSLDRGDADRRYRPSGQGAAGAHRWSGNSSSPRTINTKDSKSNRSFSLDLPDSKEVLGSVTIARSPSRPVRETFISYASLRPEVNLVERKFSRRSGSSPFFGAVSTKRQRRHLSEQGTTTSADVITYPDKSVYFGDTVMSGARQEVETTPPDAAEPSLWSAREGTKQLKDYIQTILRRTGIQESINSDDPSYSVFQSTRGSVASIQQLPGTRESRDTEVKKRAREQKRETILQDAGSDWSWETHCTPQDDQVTVIEDWPHDSPGTELGTVAGGSSELGSPNSGIGMGEGKRRSGAGKRRDARTYSTGDRYTRELDSSGVAFI